MRLAPFYIILISLFYRTLNISLNSSLLDFNYYLESATRFLNLQNPYINLLYPPASLYLFIPFALTPFYISKLFWTLLSLLSLYLGILIFLQELKISQSLALKINSFGLSLLLSLFFIQTFPVKFTLGLGQINLFVFLGYSLFYKHLNKNHSFLTGFFLALITTLKFNPLFFVILLLILKKYKSVLSFIICFLILNLSIDLFSPFHLNTSFIQSIKNMSSNYSGYYYNQSLAAVIQRLFSTPSTAISVNLFFSIILWFFTIIHTIRHPQSLIHSFSIFLVTILLTSPLTWQHHLLFTIPIFIYLFSCAFNNKSKVLIFLTTISFLLINLNLKNPQAISSQNPLYSHAFLGLLLLFITLTFASTSLCEVASGDRGNP